jgi:hypothetical protein
MEASTIALNLGISIEMREMSHGSHRSMAVRREEQEHLVNKSKISTRRMSRERRRTSEQDYEREEDGNQ